MLLLCSNGLSSDKLITTVDNLSIINKKAAIVVTADNEYKEKNYHVPRVISELESLAYTVDLFDLDKQSPDALLDYGIVEFIGGNPYYLLNSLIKTNTKPILQELTTLDTQLLIGWSAGALVMQQSLELVNLFIPEKNFVNLKDLTAMRLTDVEILPHYNSLPSKFNNYEEICKTYENNNDCNVIRLNDGDGVLINSKETTLLDVSS